MPTFTYTEPAVDISAQMPDFDSSAPARDVTITNNVTNESMVMPRYMLVQLGVWAADN